jgi:outer membrane protein OmpA-like peptidoglycan-associated protein
VSLRASRWGVLAALGLLAALAAVAEEPAYSDPWDLRAQAAAEAAVARLGAKRALDLRRVVLNILGLERGVGGTGRGVVATVQETRRAMQALGARESATEVVVELPADVLFDFDKADIRPDAAGALAQLATVLRGYPNGKARLEGHTDAKGDDAYNQRLSERRAAAVERWLVDREGIDGGRLATRGWGESRPVASNDTDAGRQKNRRVEVIIRKQ